MTYKRFVTPTEQEVNALVALFAQQQYAAAEKSAKDLIRRYPKDPFGLKALGAIYCESSRSHMAVDPMKRAIALTPRDPELHSNLGNAYKDLHKLDEAEKSYMKALAIDPGYASVYSNLGVVLKDKGKLPDAIGCYRSALLIEPSNPETRARLAYALMMTGASPEAEEVIRSVLQDYPSYVEAIQTLALLLARQERGDEALDCYQKALAISPACHDLHNNQGNLLKDLGRYTESEACYRKALELDPASSTAYNNIGMVLNAQGRTLEAEAMYRVALAMKEDFPEATSNLGVTLMETGRLEEAEAIYRQALLKRPHHVALLTNLGCVLKEQGRTDDAVQCFHLSLEHDHTYNIAGSNLLFTLNYGRLSDPSAMKIEAERFGSSCQTKASPYREWRASLGSHLRVGFVSGDLFAHPVGYFLQGLVQNIDPSKISLYAYSSTPREDSTTAILKPHFAEWRSIRGVSDQVVAATIHDDAIDILIDLSGHTANNRLPIFAFKPAPIQASWLGYFATTGVAEIDYWIGDPYVTPPADAEHFTEALWALPETYLCFTPPADAPPVAPAPQASNGYITYGCFNSLAKINDEVIALWARVLQDKENSRLFLKTRQLDDEVTREGILVAFEKLGITSDRLILEGWSPRQELLAAYGRVDIGLDPFPYPGGTTSAESLWMGVPVVTLRGNRFLSRIGESIAENAGLSGWVARTPEEYVSIATSADMSDLSLIRARMREKLEQAPLFDSKRFAMHFADALSAMAARHVLTKGVK
ncbi:tetratricopeptide repeat protein [Pseudomonas putida]|uniref:protein O-GlcNAc transferase n=1 Tax=Pseudomonas putida TaxID=303 RepID=A0A8I1EAR3_PSEPU|nr:tetratricopeptide repeat protein [Pseudomonas putida]MBI6882507.1 tetratricopeptide repeat protein [Pseudomonas putida]